MRSDSRTLRSAPRRAQGCAGRLACRRRAARSRRARQRPARRRARAAGDARHAGRPEHLHHRAHRPRRDPDLLGNLVRAVSGGAAAAVELRRAARRSRGCAFWASVSTRPTRSPRCARSPQTLHFPVGFLADSRAPGYGRIWRLPVNFTIDRAGRLVRGRLEGEEAQLDRRTPGAGRHAAAGTARLRVGRGRHGQLQ